MTETVSSKASADGWNEPTKNLPPLEVRELPEPLPLGKLIGASVILLATALGSGELLIWPYITTQAGVGLLWLATLGFLSQYFLNMEIERYTLATGETAVTGFSRFWKPWGIVFVLERVMNSIRNGLGMRETEIAREPSRPWNSHSYAVFAQVHNMLYAMTFVGISLLIEPVPVAGAFAEHKNFSP